MSIPGADADAEDRHHTRESLHYDSDNHPLPPLLELPSSEDEGQPDTEDIYHRNTKKTSAHPQANVARPSASRTVIPGAGADEKKDGHHAKEGLKCGRLPMEAIHKAQLLGEHTTQEAQAIVDGYGKTLLSIMTDAGLMTKATWAESVWNLHQAWYASSNPKTSGGMCLIFVLLVNSDLIIESIKEYYGHQMKHYEGHKDEEEYPQLWAEICAFWSESISGTKDLSSKVMVGWVMSCRDAFTQAICLTLSSSFIHSLLKSLCRHTCDAMLRVFMCLDVLFTAEMMKLHAKLRVSSLAPPYVPN